MSALPPYAVQSNALPVALDHPLDLAHQSIEIPGTRRPGQTGHYRNAAFPNFTTVETPEKQFPRSDYEMFNFGLGRCYDRPCLGHRPINPTTGELEPFYIWQSYKDVDRRRTDFGSGLLKLQADGTFGPIPRTRWSVGIWTHNRPEWQIVHHACAAYSLVVISLYETLGPAVVEFCINHAEVHLVVSSASHIPDLLRNAHATPTLKVIVCADRWQDLQPVEPKLISVGDQRRVLKSWGEQLGISVYDMEEIESLGRAHPSPHIPPSPSDKISVCYTSGTTGMPKGAVLLHRTIAAAAVANLHGQNWAGAEEVFFSYLPLSHIFERFFESIMFTLGGQIGYSCGDNLKLLEDVQILKPSIFLSVPRVLNRIYQAVLAQLDGPGFKGNLARRALQSKLHNLKVHGSNTHFLWDRLVFNKVKQALGGRVRIIGTGSAPISPEVLSFLKVAFICETSEGYGSTENAGTCTKTFLEDVDPNGTVGPPQVGQEIKLVDVPDMKYFSTDKPYPRGEICTRGEMCIPEYYKDEAKTKELIDSEGWQHSGDIGLIDEKGRIKIIDRIKNLVKLAQGEYVALEKVEGAYSVNPLVAQVYVHGDSLKSYLVAIVVVDPPAFQEFCNKLIGRAIATSEACLVPEIRKAVLNELDQTAKTAKLMGFERIRNVYLTDEAFSVENDLLTPTFKLKRNVAKSKFEPICQKLYEEHESTGGETKMKL